jgi:hypothetical protein
VSRLSLFVFFFLSVFYISIYCLLLSLSLGLSPSLFDYAISLSVFFSLLGYFAFFTFLAIFSPRVNLTKKTFWSKFASSLESFGLLEKNVENNEMI